MGVSNNITAVLNFIAILASIPIIASGIWLASKPDNECISNFRWPVVIIGILILLVSLAGFVGAYWNKQGLLALYLFCMALLIALLLFLLVFAFVVTRPDGSYDVPGRAYKEYRLDGFSSWLRNHVTSSGSWQKIRTCLAASDVCIKLTQNYITADQFFTSHISPLQNSPERHEPVASLPNEPRNPSPPPPSSIFIHLVPPCRSAAPVHFCITNAVTVQPRRFSSSATALRRFSSSATALRRFCSSATALHRFWTEMGTVGTGTNETEVASTPTPITRSTSTPQTQNPISTDDVQQTTEAPPQFVEAPTQNVPSTQVTETGTKRKSTRLTSTAWEHFKRESDKAVCNYCGKEYACNSVNHGTTNLLKHLKVCPKNPHREHDKKQKTIVLDKKDEDDKIVSLKLAEFKQDLCRDELARMIVTDELPFKFVENVGFKRFMSVSQPRFKIPGRLTIARDCMQLFREEKVKLRSFLSLNNQMVSMTTDTWTSIQNMNYMCVTAHYIDEGWELNKKILSFGLIADHKGDTIGKALEYCLKDYGISKVCTVTVDNASANNLAIAYLIRNMSAWNGTTLMNGEYMHMRCCAHILNLIVNDGLKEIDESIVRIRAACKYVRASPARLACFKKCVQDANISSSQMLVLDVPTRWNSTYLMLEVAEKYEKAFYRLESDDPFYVNNLDESGGPPNNDDWIRARLYMKFLKIFYEATLSFSSSLHVSANTFIRKFVKIQTALNSFIESDDFGLQRVASNMKKKLDKYWDVDGQMNYLLFVAVFLDPRLKLEYFEFSFPMIYGNEKCKEIMKKVMNLVKNLFAQYKGMYPYVPDSLDSSGASSDVSHVTSSNVSTNVDKVDVDDEYNISVRKKKGELKKNELDRYIEDGVELDHDGFDILRWWRVKGHAYYILSHMARDILAIPVSTVSSESAFSTGGRVLDPYRSSLHATTVEVSPADPTVDLNMQLTKLGHGLLSGKYSVPASENDEKANLATSTTTAKQEGIRPHMFKAVIAASHPEFSSVRQQDALEFFLHFLDQVERGHVGKNELDPARCFKFGIEDRILCSSGKVAYNRRHDYILSLNIPLHEATNKEELESFHKLKAEKLAEGMEMTGDEIVRPRVPLEACLANFSAPEEIHDFYSTALKTKTTALKTAGLTSFPDYLVLHMRRFVMETGWVPKKLDVYVDVPDIIDISHMRSKGHQAGEELLPDGVPNEEDSNKPLANEEIVSQLVSMGFNHLHCQKAAINTSNVGVEEAMNWLLSHMDDPDIDIPISEGHGKETSNFDQSKVDTLISFGFQEDIARKALKASGGDIEKATDWIFSNPDASVSSMDATTSNDTSIPNDVGLPDGGGRYRLIGVVSHSGTSTQCGHYVAHILKDGRWVIFNDDKVGASINPPKEMGYLYFYERLDG